MNQLSNVVWLITISTIVIIALSAARLQPPAADNLSALRMISLIRARAAQKKHHLTTSTAISATSSPKLVDEQIANRTNSAPFDEQERSCEIHPWALIERSAQQEYARFMRMLLEDPTQQPVIIVLSLCIILTIILITCLIICVVCAAKRCKTRRAGFALPPPPVEMLAAQESSVDA